MGSEAFGGLSEEKGDKKSPLEVWGADVSHLAEEGVDILRVLLVIGAPVRRRVIGPDSCRARQGVAKFLELTFSCFHTRI